MSAQETSHGFCDVCLQVMAFSFWRFLFQSHSSSTNDRVQNGQCEVLCPTAKKGTAPCGSLAGLSPWLSLPKLLCSCVAPARLIRCGWRSRRQALSCASTCTGAPSRPPGSMADAARSGMSACAPWRPRRRSLSRPGAVLRMSLLRRGRD